jgi:Protein of unknown function (DUF1592)/Protein of unknown function (DUF1588)/Protein of unknown function (DUF1595)/Protein of unknown function (DUF1585)/Protein of unknown function (DUF1587)
MLPVRARKGLGRVKPWMACLALASLVGCGDGTIGYEHGRNVTGTTGSTTTGGGASTGGGSTTGGTGGPDACMDQAVGLSAPRVWRLTTAQMKNTLVEAFGFAGTSIDSYPADSRSDITEYANVANRLVVGDLLTTYYDKTAEEVSANVVSKSSSFLGCAVADLGAGTCLQDFVTTYGKKAWRRPLTTTEVTDLVGLYRMLSPGAGAQTAFAMVVQAIILSPKFAFRGELGTSDAPGTTTTMTDYEIASALSYMIWDAPPDQALYDAAAAGTLHDPSTLRAQVHRMFTASTRAPVALSSFMAQWLHTDGLLTVTKDSTLFPEFKGPVIQDLSNEMGQVLGPIAFDPAGDHPIGALLTTHDGFVTANTAAIYGVPAPAAGAGFVRTHFDPNQRSGLLTLASWLAAVSNASDTALPARGNFVRGALLCDATPPPPANFKFDPSQITPDMTERQKFLVHTKSSTCAACHDMFDGIGFALEQYDPIGRFRTIEQGKTIDPSGTVPLPSGKTLEFANFIDMMNQVAASPDFGRCYASQYLRYATGRETSAVGDCELQKLTEAVGAAGNTIDSLPAAVAALPSFITRQN